VGNEVEKLYADACVLYSDSKLFIKTTDDLINQLKDKLAKEDEFVVNFTSLAYDQTSLLYYIFDRFNNFGLDPGQCKQIFNPGPNLRRRNYTIEHFLAQNPEPEAKVKKSDMEMVDNIGNLLAIYFKDNGSLGNGSPAEKLKLLQGKLAPKIENLNHVTAFISEYGDEAATWGAATIKKRALEMAQKAYRQVWKIN
jgi:hypothetical protein